MIRFLMVAIVLIVFLIVSIPQRLGLAKRIGIQKPVKTKETDVRKAAAGNTAETGEPGKAPVSGRAAAGNPGEASAVDPADSLRAQQKSLRIVQAMFRLILKISGVKVTVKGRENIPDGAVLYVGNHRSYFDILVGYTTVPGLTGFVAKAEMEKIPCLSDWMRLVNCLFLNRKDIKEGLKTIMSGIGKVKDGVSIWIFPEGTRNPHEDLTDLLPFKEGSLKIAEKSGCPVVPVAITGTAEVFENHLPRICPAKVTIEYGEPIYIKQLPAEQRKHCGAYTRDVIIEMLKKEQQARRA